MLARAFLLSFVAAISFALLPTASASAAGPSLTVSVDPVPLKARSGDEVATDITISNGTSQTANFDLAPVAVVARNEGGVVLDANAKSPLVSGMKVNRNVSIDGGKSMQVKVRIPVPLGLEANIYLVGVLVVAQSPLATSGVNNQLQVLEHVAVDVVGAAKRSIAVSQSLKPRSLVGRTANGQFVVTNDGLGGVVMKRSVVMSFNGGSPVQNLTGTDSEVLLAGLHKTYAYTWHAGWFAVGMAHPTIDISYDDDGVTAYKQFRGPSIFVVTPAALAVIVGVFVLLTIVIVVFIRRRKMPIAVTE